MCRYRATTPIRALLRAVSDTTTLECPPRPVESHNMLNLVPRHRAKEMLLPEVQQGPALRHCLHRHRHQRRCCALTRTWPWRHLSLAGHRLWRATRTKLALVFHAWVSPWCALLRMFQAFASPTPTCRRRIPTCRSVRALCLMRRIGLIHSIRRHPRTRTPRG